MRSGHRERGFGTDRFVAKTRWIPFTPRSYLKNARSYLDLACSGFLLGCQAVPRFFQDGLQQLQCLGTESIHHSHPPTNFAMSGVIAAATPVGNSH